MAIFKNKRRIFISLVALVALIFLLNLDVSIHQGINGHYRYVHMPLYVKWTQFLARHYEYAKLAREVTHGCKTDEEKTLAILKWTKENIKDTPPGMPMVDDHILTIIIKGYGSPRQFQDVFATLCAYAGLPAFWDEFYDKNRKAKYSISFVKIDGKWKVFDAYYDLYFRNAKGEIASIDDIIDDPSVVSGDRVDNLFIGDIPYKDFYYKLFLDPIEKHMTLRSYRQMPLRRIFYEARRALRIEKEESDF